MTRVIKPSANHSYNVQEKETPPFVFSKVTNWCRQFLSVVLCNEQYCCISSDGIDNLTGTTFAYREIWLKFYFGNCHCRSFSIHAQFRLLIIYIFKHYANDVRHIFNVHSLTHCESVNESNAHVKPEQFITQTEALAIILFSY